MALSGAGELHPNYPNSCFCLSTNPHPIFNVVVDDEIEFLVRKTVMLCKNFVNFANNSFYSPQYTIFIFLSASACRANGAGRHTGRPSIIANSSGVNP